jgi:hypothetical protein
MYSRRNFSFAHTGMEPVNEQIMFDGVGMNQYISNFQQINYFGKKMKVFSVTHTRHQNQKKIQYCSYKGFFFQNKY